MKKTIAAILLLVFVLAWTYTYDTDTPAGTDAPNVIDDRIREVKDAVQERQNVDHYWPLTGTQVSDADAGKHRQVTLQAPRTSPSSIDADEAMLYSKDVSAKAELHFMDEDEHEIQLTSGGYINGAALKADSVGAGAIQIANNTYLVAANAAGDGEVNLIKANASDVAVLPDGSELASSAAPTADADIANKKYVDDQITSYAVTYSGTEVFAEAAAPQSYTDLDLSAVVGANRAVVHLKVKNTSGSNRTFVFRTNGETDEVGYSTPDPESGATCAAYIRPGYIGYFTVLTDASGIIEWKAAGTTNASVTLLTYQVCQ